MHRQEKQQRGVCHGAFLEDLADHPKMVRRDSHHPQLLSGGKNTLNGVPPASLWNQLLFEMLINELTEEIEAVLIKSASNMKEKEKG